MSVYSLDSLENEVVPPLKIHNNTCHGNPFFLGRDYTTSANETAVESVRIVRNPIIARAAVNVTRVDPAALQQQSQQSSFTSDRLQQQQQQQQQQQRQPGNSAEASRSDSTAAAAKKIPGTAVAAGTLPSLLPSGIAFHREPRILGDPVAGAAAAVTPNARVKSSVDDKKKLGCCNSAGGAGFLRLPSRQQAGVKNKRSTASSYSELYRRRFSVEKSRGEAAGQQSREAVCNSSSVGVSICGGDSFDERRRVLIETEPSTDSFHLPGDDDQSELSFYRRLMLDDVVVGAAAAAAAAIGDAGDDSRRPENLLRRLRVGSATTFRPYTLQDYQNIRATSAKLDRSLGPDWERLNAKRECLVRRRSYGDAVSALNRQRISQAAKKHKAIFNTTSRADCSNETFQSCMPGVVVAAAAAAAAPAEITKDVSKRREEKSSSTVSEQQRQKRGPVKAIWRNQSEAVAVAATAGSRRPLSTFAKMPSITKTTSPRDSLSRKSKSVPQQQQQQQQQKQRRTCTTAKHGACTASCEEPSLQTLAARHFNEKRMIDQLIKRSMFA